MQKKNYQLIHREVCVKGLPRICFVFPFRGMFASKGRKKRWATQCKRNLKSTTMFFITSFSPLSHRLRHDWQEARRVGWGFEERKRRGALHVSHALHAARRRAQAEAARAAGDQNAHVASATPLFSPAARWPSRPEVVWAALWTEPTDVLA